MNWIWRMASWEQMEKKSSYTIKHSSWWSRADARAQESGRRYRQRDYGCKGRGKNEVGSARLNNEPKLLPCYPEGRYNCWTLFCSIFGGSTDRCSPFSRLAHEVFKSFLRFYLDTCDDIPAQQTLRIRKLLQKYQDIFNQADPKSRTSIVWHKINTEDAAPILQTGRRLPLAMCDEADKINREIRKGGRRLYKWYKYARKMVRHDFA